MQPTTVFKARISVDGRSKVVCVVARDQSDAKAKLKLEPGGKVIIIDGPFPV